MRLFKTLLIAAIAVGLSAASATALTSVTHSNNTGGAILTPGAIFDVDVTLSFDGGNSLTGAFTSAGWDPNQLTLIGNTPAPFAIFFGATGFLAKVVDPSSFPGDAAGTIRSVQFGAGPNQAAGAGAPVLITTLTFLVVAAGDGIAEIDVVLNAGDGCFGTLGAPCAPGDFLTSGTAVLVPEPGTALLMGLGLAGLAYAGRRR
jgi:hypothetical protein